MKHFPVKMMVLVALAITLFSFSTNFGGEGFEILLNGNAVLKQYGNDLNTVKSLKVTNSSADDKLTIRYYHCGRVGKNRIVTIKDANNKVMKTWHFKDVNQPVSDMSCKVIDILKLDAGGNRVFKLYYSSSELPDGRMLASVIINKTKVTTP